MQLIHPYIFAGMPHNKPTIERVEQVICDYFKVDKDAIHEKCRKRQFVQARQYIAYFMFNVYSITCIELARYFKADHTTILHSVKVVEIEMKNSDMALRHIYNIQQLLKFI